VSEFRDDRLLCGTDIGGRSGDSQLHFIHEVFSRESSFLPPANQLHTCHPER
jgi:hypothetical protein